MSWPVSFLELWCDIIKTLTCLFKSIGWLVQVWVKWPVWGTTMLFTFFLSEKSGATGKK